MRACELAGEPAGQHVGLAARNRAILWPLWDTGLQVAEVCRLRLADVDRAQGTVTVRGKAGDLRTFPLSADRQRAMCTYLEQARLTPAWESVVPEVRDLLLLTEQQHPLTKNSLTMVFKRLRKPSGVSRKPICPSLLRDTYAIRFLQAGGRWPPYQEQLGVTAHVSVKRYQHFCEQQDQERGTQEYSEGSLPPRHVRRGKHKILQQCKK